MLGVCSSGAAGGAERDEGTADSDRRVGARRAEGDGGSGREAGGGKGSLDPAEAKMLEAAGTFMRGLGIDEDSDEVRPGTFGDCSSRWSKAASCGKPEVHARVKPKVPYHALSSCLGGKQGVSCRPRWRSSRR